MTEYPYVRAAFINAIGEEGTKEDAVKFLQEQWNENCWLRGLNAELLTALKEWQRLDNLVGLDPSVRKKLEHHARELTRIVVSRAEESSQ